MTNPAKRRTNYATCPDAETTGRPCPVCSADGTARRTRDANADAASAASKRAAR